MNKDLLFKVMIFLTGGAVGSAVTWKLVKTKYEQIANEEIDSMREYYNEKKKKDMLEVSEVIHEGFKAGDLTVQDIRNKVQELGYANEQWLRDNENSNEEEDEEIMDKPYVIPPEESWEQDYPTISLTYYEGDKVLANERNEMIANADELVGEDFADHFGEYEEDSVFIRNDNHKVYYEILRDYGNYSES